MHTPEEVLRTVGGRALVILLSHEYDLGGLIRQELFRRLEPPAKKRGRPPKVKASGVQPTGEFVRSQPAPELRGVLPEDFDLPGQSRKKKEGKKSRRFSAATRKKMAEAQRKRWAKRQTRKKEDKKKKK